jgi:tetratricopeptide (TPR) repeat protein
MSAQTKSPGRVKRALALAGAALLALFVPGEPNAQPGGGDVAPAISDPAEEAYALLIEGKLITARARADEALRQDPESITAHFVMGTVLHEAEGALARAMHHLVVARQLFERRHGADPSPDAPRSFHQMLLQHTQRLAGQMERFDEQLRLIALHDALYDPDLYGERAWTLLHLGRFDEARASARAGIDTGLPWVRSLGLNALCAIEGEAQKRQPFFDACLAALDDGRSDNEIRKKEGLPPSPIAVDAYNASNAAYSILRFEEVEKLALEAARSPETTVANPYRILVGLYTGEGRLSEAVSAAREMQRWRMRLPASLRDQDRAETDAVLASVLLIFGEADAASRLITRAIERPDRRGMISSKHEQAMSGHALVRRALDRQKRELEAERASAEGLFDRAKSAIAAGGAGVMSLPDDERIAGMLADDERLLATFRMRVGGGMIAPEWLFGDLIEVLGPGVVAVSVAQARAFEGSALPELLAYYDAMDAEIALARGDEARAVEIAKRSIDALPKAEVLLKARVAAVGAEALRRRGEIAASLPLFHRAMELDPGVLRRLRLALPASVRAESGGAASLAAEMLARSPRLSPSQNGFQVALSGAPGLVRACLRSAEGAVLSCAEIAPKRGEAERDVALRLAAAFHKQAFAPRVSLTTGDLHSLDGSTTLAGQAQRERMEELLRDMAESSPVR